MPIYKTSREGKMFLAGLEGIAQTKYKDSVGVWTIAIGATASEIPDLAKWSMNRKLSIEECFNLLDKSLVKYETAINKSIKNGAMLSQAQFDALVSICYNIGTHGAANSTFMKRINANAPMGRMTSMLNFNEDQPIADTHSRGDLEYKEERVFGFGSTGSIVEAIMMWNKPSEIIGRRTKEAKLFASGTYPTSTKASVFPVSAKGQPQYGKAKIIDCKDYI